MNGQADTWDNNGNLLNDGTSTYTYDAANRLVSSQNSGVSSSYVYDGLGNRVSQTVNGVTTNYALDVGSGLTQVLSDSTNGQQPATNYYLYGLGRIGEQQSSGFVYHLGDALGSVRQLVNGSGAVLLAQSYEPYGSVFETRGSGHSIFGFAGEAKDANGLIFLRARYYNPTDGRFFGRDPWAGDALVSSTLHRYLYSANNPVMYVDPSGRCVEPISFIVCSAVIGAVAGAVIGATVDYAGQVYNNYQTNGGDLQKAATTNIDLGSIASSAAKGVVVGGVGGAVFGLTLGLAGVVAAATPLAISSASAYGALAGAANIAIAGAASGQASRLMDNRWEGRDWYQGLGNPKDMLVDATLSVVLWGGAKFIGGGRTLQELYSGGCLEPGLVAKLNPSGFGANAGALVVPQAAYNAVKAPNGLVENPYRSGSYGKYDGPGGKFREYWRLDESQPGMPGWRAVDHIHIYGGKEHLDPNTPFDPNAPHPDDVPPDFEP